MTIRYQAKASTYQIFQCVKCGRERTYGASLIVGSADFHKNKLPPMLHCMECEKFTRHSFVRDGARPEYETSVIRENIRRYAAYTKKF